MTKFFMPVEEWLDLGLTPSAWYHAIYTKELLLQIDYTPYRTHGEKFEMRYYLSADDGPWGVGLGWFDSFDEAKKIVSILILYGAVFKSISAQRISLDEL